MQPEALLAETGMVRRLAQALVRRADLAHDVTQDVMLAALRQPHPPEHLRGWLAAVTRRLAGKATRAQHVRARHEGQAAPPPASDAEQHTTERLQLHRRLTDAVIGLPEPYRTTVTLRFFDELPPRVIAQRLGTSSEVVRKRLQRGLEMLRERLDGDFGDREQWVRAFAVVGLLEVGSPWLLLTVLAMNKLAVATAAVLAVGLWWIWPDAPSPPPAVVAAVEPASPFGVPPATDSAQRDAAEPTQPTRAPTVAATTPDCTVGVTDELGTPVADAVVHCWPAGSEDSLERVTDRDGRGAFGPLRGAGAVLVVADGRFPHHVELAELAGEHQVALPSGAVIGGVLLVDGLPGAGWRLTVDMELPATVPEPVRQLHRWRGWATRCDAAGRFTFVGVPADWQGTLSLPQALWLFDERTAGDLRRVPVIAGQRDLDIRATQLPTVRGRVVWRDDGEPVAWPQGMAHAEFADGRNSPSLGFLGYRDGTFVVGFYDSSPSRREQWRVPTRRPAVTRVTLSIADHTQAAETALELDAARFAAGSELVVRLDRVVHTHFRCIDKAGQPIAGARVQTRGTSGRTDADGRGTFVGAITDVALVGSPRHRIGPVAPRATALGTADDPVVYELEPTNAVRVRIEGRNVDRQRLKLRGDVPMFAGGRRHDSLDDSLHGTDLDISSGANGRTLADGSTDWHDHYLNLTADPRGEAVLWSLEPGTVCELSLLDDFGRARGTRRFRAPAFGDELEVVLRLPAYGGPFVGRVVDVEGRPLAGVGVAFRSEYGDESYLAHRRTDAQGRFELTRAWDLSQATLNLQYDGYAEQRYDNLPAGGVPQTYVLQRGRELIVHVVDEHDAPLDLAPVWQRAGVAARREWQRAGVYRWLDLPAGPLTFVCRVGGDEFAVEHDNASPAATLRVPRPASVRVQATNGWPVLADARNRLVVVARCIDGGHRPHRFSASARGDAELLLPGTWRLALFEWSQPDRSLPAVERSLGLSAEITLRAGDDATAVLR